LATDVSPLVPAGRQVINGYGDGGFRISGQRFEGSVLVFPDRTLAIDLASAEALTQDHLQEILAAAPAVELVLFGTGLTIAMPPAALRAVLRERRIGLEPMDTGAACRTYNVLMAEDRRVAALLVAVG
jgi:uncharacterized protein